MIGTLVSLVIYLIVVGLVIWLLLYLVDNLPLPPPFHQVARVVIIAIGVLILIILLLSLLGEAPIGKLKLG